MTHPPESFPDLPRPDDATRDDATLDDATLDAMPDVPLDPALVAAARHYHAPPSAVPADAMWAAIQARRAAGGASAADAASAAVPALRVERVERTGRPGRAVDASPRGGAWARPASRWASLAAAAVALLAVGVGVGRVTAPGGDAPAPVAAIAPATPASPAAPTVVAAAPDAAPDAAPSADVAPSAAPRAPRTAAPTALPARGARPAPAAPATQVAEAPAPASPALPNAGGSAPLRVATAQHLARVEALLTTFAADRGGAPTGDAAEADAAWARDLLVTTRLLLDSPAGRDPTRRALLEDLELVLVQIARLPRADTPAERALIDRAIRRGDVLGKLRSAAPDAPSVATPRSAPARGA
jgi:hypothetical protein